VIRPGSIAFAAASPHEARDPLAAAGLWTVSDDACQDRRMDAETTALLQRAARCYALRSETAAGHPASLASRSIRNTGYSAATLSNASTPASGVKSK
jgi:hypothetical protein